MASSGGKAYEIDSSLLFEDGDSSYLTRSPGSAGNLKTWTISFWTKRANLGALQIMYASDNGSSGTTDYGIIYFDSSDRMGIYYGNITIALTNRKFRDVSSWYHIYIKMDTTQGTASNRWDLKINGVSETSFSESVTPNQNTDLPFGNNHAHYFGRIGGGYYYPGYIAEFHNINGTVKAVTDFAETDSDTGEWIPKEYTGGSYGTTGFYLPFKKNDRYSVYCDGTTSAGIKIADHSDFALGTNSFTAECWFYRDDDAGNLSYLCGTSNSAGADSSGSIQLEVGTDNKPRCYVFLPASTAGYIDMHSSATVVDSTWNHVAVVRNGTAFALYLNGTSVATETASYAVNDSSDKFGVGVLGDYTAGHWKGWISNFRLVNGTAVYTSNFTPSTSPLTAVTNTKLLCCQDQDVTTDNSGTSKTLVRTAANTYSQKLAPFTYDWYEDQSGQDNDWTPVNITVNDVMIDTPTNNFATFNSLDSGSNITLSQGNLRSSGSGWGDTFSTIKIPHTGKWYIELLLVADGNLYFGLWTDNYTDTGAGQNYGTGKQFTHSGSVSGGASGGYISGGTSTGDLVSMAVDCDAGKLYWAIDGTWGSSGNPATGANPGLTFTATDNYKINMAGASGHQTIINYGQNGTFNGTKIAQGNTDGAGIGNFYYAPPSGFKALCTKNLATPTIKYSLEHFNTVLYTGSNNDAVSQSVTGVGFEPDLVILKRRDQNANPGWWDQVRGEHKGISSASTNAEATDTYGLETFDSDGFTVREADTAQGKTNTGNMTSWNWKASGGSGSANTQGDINSTVSVNNTAGFSIVSYTGDRTGAGVSTVGHGLSSAPKVVITKRKDGVSNWYVQHPSTTAASKLMMLHSTAAETDKSGNGTLARPTSTVFSVNWSDGLGTNGQACIAYCFAEVEGFSKFGDYRGNGAAENGPYVYTGFAPAVVIVKEISEAGGSWFIWDNKREVGNVKDTAMWLDTLNADTSHAEYEIDFLSNGFKIRGNSGGTNDSGETNIYMAFAEAPFKYSNAQ